jgi:molybdopterin biosynthesis enzyme
LHFRESLEQSEPWLSLFDNPPMIEVIRRKGAGILSSIALADAILEIPENVEGIEANSLVHVKLIRDL